MGVKTNRTSFYAGAPERKTVSVSLVTPVVLYISEYCITDHYD